MNLNEWNARLHGLVIFRALLDDDVIAKLVDLTDRMAADPRSTGAVCGAAASFESALFEHTTNFGEYLSAAVLEAETVCVRQAAVSKVPPGRRRPRSRDGLRPAGSGEQGAARPSEGAGR